MILQIPMNWYHLQSIVRVLERDLGSYAQIECMLFKEADWAHFRQSEIDRLDAAADRLFREVRVE